jgi:predicted O-methyltransferase YrrM
MRTLMERQTWMGALAIGFSTLGFLLAITSFPHVGAFVFLGLSFTLLIITRQLILWSNLRKHIEILSRQVNAVQALGSLQSIPVQHPTFLLTHSVAPDLLMLMGEFIRRYPIERVLELGSGASSLYLATMLQRFKNGGTLISLENSEEWKELVQQELNVILSGKQVSAHVLYAPITSMNTRQGNSFLFYSLPKLLTERLNMFDLIFIDGPSDITQRVPALEVLLTYASQNCLLVWDDGEHPVIRTAIEDFVSKNRDWSFKYYTTVKGTCVLYRLSSNLPLP